MKQFVPEGSAEGQNQSNGKAKRSVLRLQDLIRTVKSALDNHIGCRIPSKHAIVRWIEDNDASVYYRYVRNDDGSTPYEATLAAGLVLRWFWFLFGTDLQSLLLSLISQVLMFHHAHWKLGLAHPN